MWEGFGFRAFVILVQFRRFPYHIHTCTQTYIYTHVSECAYCIRQFPKIGGPHYRPQNIMIPIMGTPKKGPIILGHPKP